MSYRKKHLRYLKAMIRRIPLKNKLRNNLRRIAKIRSDCGFDIVGKFPLSEANQGSRMIQSLKGQSMKYLSSDTLQALCPLYKI